jgi:putative transposase
MLARYYVQYYNFCYQRTGTLWEGRYKATLIDSEAYLLLTCMLYIVLNPMRAGMVIDPADYPWSSYHYNALGRLSGLVVLHPNTCAWVIRMKRVRSGRLSRLIQASSF